MGKDHENKQFIKKPKWPLNIEKDALLTNNYRMQVKIFTYQTWKKGKFNNSKC